MKDQALLTLNLAYLRGLLQAQREAFAARRSANDVPGAREPSPAEEMQAILQELDLKAAIEEEAAARARHSRIALTWGALGLLGVGLLTILGRTLPEPLDAAAPDAGKVAGMMVIITLGALCLGVLGATLSLLLGPRALGREVDAVDYRWGTYPRIMAGAIVGFLVGTVLFRRELKIFFYDTTSAGLDTPIVTAVLATFAGGLVTRFVLSWLPFPFSLPRG